MIPSEIIAQMRRVVKVDTSQYTDANALIDLNTLKDDFWSAIVSSVSEKYNWERWKTNSVALQSEYAIPTVAYNTAGAKLLNGVAINYIGETYSETGELIYLPCKEVNPDTLPNDWSYYVENQSYDEPIYYVADNSYFIAPAPRTAITEGIKLTGIRKIPNYALDTTEANMKITVDQQTALMWGLCVYGHMNKGSDETTIISAENRWLQKRSEAIKALEARVENPVMLKYPNDTSNDITF